MSNGSRRRLSRGDRRRNEKLAALRAVITRESAVLAFDLAADKQVCAVTDPDSRVLARRTVRCKAWQLTEAVAWGLVRAAEAGFSSVVVACEPTGHRWRVLDQIAAAQGVVLVCVQPLLVARAREAEDFTRNKNDDVDAVIIARLVTELRCYLPERADPTWARLRHLGARRTALTVAVGAARQQVRDLLECAWPAVLDAACQPLDSASWLAALTVALDRIAASGDLGGDRPGRVGRVHRRGPRRTGRHPLVLRDRARGVRRRHRPRTQPDRGDRPARRRAGTSGVRPVRPRRPPHRDHPGRGADARRARPARPDSNWSPPFPGSPRSARPRSWPRPATPPGSARPGPWSNTPGCARGTTPRAPTRARPRSAAAADPSCAWPPGGRCSPHCATTPCWPPATPTWSAARTTR